MVIFRDVSDNIDHIHTDTYDGMHPTYAFEETTEYHSTSEREQHTTNYTDDVSVSLYSSGLQPSSLLITDT